MRRKNQFTKNKFFLSLALLVSLITSCAPSPKVLQASVERDSSPVISDPDLAGLVAGNSAFAWDLYQAVRGQDGNQFYSPYSISIALAMTYAGARGNTEAQMAETLHYDLPQDRLHPAFNYLDLELARRGDSSNYDDGDVPFQLNIANSLWAQEGYPFLSEFLDLLSRNYGAGLRLLNFVSDAEAARVEINDWVAEETDDRVKDLIPVGAIDDLTRLVLTNAIYFQAEWYHPFLETETKDGQFTLLDGSQVQVPMMSHAEPMDLPYKAGDGYQAVELPYVGEATSMVILVPDAGRFEEFEASLDAVLVEEVLDGLVPGYDIIFTMPKFSFKADYDLKNTLASMGMSDAFKWGLADFSGMDGSRDLLIGDVFHKAFVAVDEKGTEAAAATAVIVILRSAKFVKIELTVDRPFIFMIRDKPTGTVLFIGRVLNPQG